MAKERRSCKVELYMDGEDVKARYSGKIGSSDDASLESDSSADFDLGANLSKAEDLMAAAEAAMDSDEDIV